MLECRNERTQIAECPGVDLARIGGIEDGPVNAHHVDAELRELAGQVAQRTARLRGHVRRDVHRPEAHGRAVAEGELAVRSAPDETALAGPGLVERAQIEQGVRREGIGLRLVGKPAVFGQTGADARLPLAVGNERPVAQREAVERGDEVLALLREEPNLESVATGLQLDRAQVHPVDAHVLAQIDVIGQRDVPAAGRPLLIVEAPAKGTMEPELSRPKLPPAAVGNGDRVPRVGLGPLPLAGVGEPVASREVLHFARFGGREPGVVGEVRGFSRLGLPPDALGLRRSIRASGRGRQDQACDQRGEPRPRSRSRHADGGGGRYDGRRRVRSRMELEEGETMRRQKWINNAAGVLAGVLASASPLWAQERPLAFVGAHLIPIEGEELDDGVLVVEGGRITAVGPAGATAIPANAERIDVSDKVIMPGLICTHSHIGGWGGGDGSAPLQPDTRILDAINVRSSGFRRAHAGGLTTLNIMPGSGHLLSGQTIYVKLRDGDTIDDLFILDEEGKPMGGMKMANGTNSMRKPPFPGTRSKSAALARELFVKAQGYRDKIERAAGDPEKMPERDLALEGMVEVLEGKRTVHFHTHRHDDIMTVIRLSQEFGFRVVLHHVSEGWKVAEEIAKAGVPCSIIVVDSPGGKLEAINLVFETGAVLDQAGVLVAYHTDDWITDSRLFLRSPALGMRAGLSREAALRSVTLAGATMIDLADRIGSLQVGKDADFIVLSGDPMSVYTKVLETWVEGKRVFDRSDPDDRLFAVGGYGASNDRDLYLCCQQEREEEQ